MGCYNKHMTKSKREFDPIALQAIHQSDLARYQTIAESNSTIDTKNGILISAIVAMGVFIFQEPLYLKATSHCLNANYVLFTLLLTGTILIITSLGITIYAILPRKWRYPSNTIDEQPGYIEKDGQDALLQLISDIESAMPENDKTVRFKAKLFITSLILFIIATILLIIVKQNIG